MNDNDELESISKDVLLINLPHFLSRFLEDTEGNKKNRTPGVPVTICRIQLYIAEAAHTVRGNFVVICGLMLPTIMRC